MSIDEKKWKTFERVVAAIHQAQSSGAEVEWNAHINGRQFDVAIRFSHGLYQYLTVVECKDHSRRISVEYVDALATKARDAQASKAILISKNGFQAGCYDVAKRHGISLLTIDETRELPEDLLLKGMITALSIFNVQLLDMNRNVAYQLWEDRGMLQYLMENAVVSMPEKTLTINDLVESEIAQNESALSTETRVFTIDLPVGTKTTLPVSAGMDNSITTSFVRFSCHLFSARSTKGPTLDPRLISLQYKIHDEIEETTTQVPAEGLKLGFDTIFQEGCFYTQPQIGFYYYCESVDSEIAIMTLVESYQYGMLAQVQMKVPLYGAQYYVQVNDKSEINRLQRMLDVYHNNLTNRNG